MQSLLGHTNNFMRFQTISLLSACITLTRHCSRTTARPQHSRIFNRKKSQKTLKNTTVTAGFYPITGLTSRTENSSRTSLTSYQPLHLRLPLFSTTLQIIHLFDPSPHLHQLSSTALQTNHSFIWDPLTSIK
jgi:hypothetical protein